MPTFALFRGDEIVREVRFKHDQTDYDEEVSLEDVQKRLMAALEEEFPKIADEHE